jgi:chemotaxis protein MotB
MTPKLVITCTLISGLFLCSCGTSKKLDAANAQLGLANSKVQQLEASNAELTAKQKELQNQGEQLAATNTSLSQEYNRYKATCEVSNRKLAALQAAARQDDEEFAAMGQKIAEAMQNFIDKGVEVYSKDRLIHVNMADNLLYKSGSAALGKEGKEALAAVAAALNDYPNLKVIVVGNTDDQKFKNGHTDNMSLSTERANGVVRVLRDNYKVDATRLTAAGQGKYNPVADNATAQGRAKNRRTEIILRPDLLKLWKSVQQ